MIGGYCLFYLNSMASNSQPSCSRPPHFQDFMSRFTIQFKEPSSDRTLLKDNLTSDLILMREIPIHTHLEYKQMVEELSLQQQLRHQNLLALKEFEFMLEEVREEGPQRRVLCFFEYSKYPLRMEIEERRGSGEMFGEEELWEVLSSVLKALGYLQSESIGHGSVTTSDIFIS